ncbi:MAG TPA: PIN domain-containing protein [Thermoanaerobaculia bacterium]|nr:PIN domain-containing protein [Thermoanaerobaculia bacterium]
MPAPAFVDTNILVYADDRAQPAKQSRAQDLIRQLIRERTGRLSTQVLAEYFVAATRKLGLDAAAVRRRVELYSRFDVVSLQPADVLGAIDLHRLHGFSLWDALIIRASLLAGCRRLYTEDLQSGFRIETLEIVNPFA